MKPFATRGAGILLILLASCSVGPDYVGPAVEAPPGYKSATAQDAGSPALDRRWWRIFGDATLNSLEEAAVAANQDLKAALARVEQARAAVRIVGSQQYPSATFDPLAQRFRTSANGTRGSGAGGKSVTTNDFQLPIDFSYEVDVWGRVRRSVEASVAQAQASEDDFIVALQSVEADVAQDYFTLRSLDAQAEILKRTVEIYQRQLSLLGTQFRAGLVGRITVVQQETQLYSTSTLEIDVRRQRADVEHALALLTGRPPSELNLAQAPLDLQPPQVPAGLPSELLRRRPDVAQAERMLAAASAQIGVAVAQYYPDLRLSGQVGLESVDLRHLFDWQSRIWSLAASALTPLFLGGQLDASLDQARARHREALAVYQSRVLSAFRDVEDSLTDLHLRAEATEAQAKAVAAAREYVTLSETQFKQGIVSYLQVTDAQRSLLVNELAAAQLQNQRLNSSVLLIKALGAGWDSEAPSELPKE
jgi:multidrug efflux system outer membrane protein